jgi:hypothetical protein
MRHRRLVVGLAAACIGLVPATAHAQSIPTPEQFYGFKMGTEGKLPSWGKTKEYFKLIGDRSPKADYFVAGKTTENDDYPYLIISSAQNMGRLDQILEANNRLAEAKGLTQEAAAELAGQTKPVYLIEAMMHSTEVGNMPAIVDIVHRFATENSPYTREVLKDAVIVVIPAANPDGWRKVVDYFDQTANTSFARTYPDLYHHFAGHDDNRDWFLFTQKETQMRIDLTQRFNPVVEHFMHQQGANGSRIFMPPWAEPVSPNLDPIAHESGNALGLEMGKYLTADGYKGVQHSMGTQNSYGIMFSADVATYTSWRGASLVLTETAGQRDLAYQYNSQNPLGPQGRSMDVPDPYRGTTWTLEQASEYAKAALYAGVRSVARNHQDWLVNTLYKTTSKTLNGTDAPYAYVLPAGQRDPYAVYETLHTLELADVKIERATAPFTANGKSYPAGSYVLRTQQRMGRFLNQILDNAEYPQWARPCSTCPLTMPYSEFTDSVPIFFGLQSEAVPSAFTVATEPVTTVMPEPVLLPAAPPATGAYLVAPGSYGLAKLLGGLQKWDVPTFRAGAAFSAGGKDYAPGTVIVPPTARARMVLEETAKATGIAVGAVDTIPDVAGFKLKPGTRIGLIRGANNMPGGWLMWLFDHFGMEYEVVKTSDYDKLDALYDTIVLAPGVTRARIVSGLDTTRYPAEWAWLGGAGEAGWSKLAAFVTGGGTLLGLGSASETAQQLLNLPIQRVATTQPFTIGGSLLRETYDPTVPAAWGLKPDGATYFNNDRAWNVSDPNAQIAGAYPGTGSMLASGYEVGAEQLRGKADVVSLKAGQGNVTVVGSQNTFRSWPRALWPLVANTVYHGPSSAVSAVDIKTLAAAAVAAERGEEPAAPTVSAPEVKPEAQAPAAAPVATPAPAPAVQVASATRTTVSVSCKLASSRRAVTCTIKGAKGSNLRADLAHGKAKARRSGRGTVKVTLRVAKRLNRASKVTVKVTSGKTAGAVKARAGRKATITLR